MQQSQQPKEHSSLEDIMKAKSIQWRATTTQDGANWTTCNQFAEIIVQSSMVIKFMSLEELEQSKSWIFLPFLPLERFYCFIFKIYRNLEWRWRFKKNQPSRSKTFRILELPRINSGWSPILCQSVNKKLLKLSWILKWSELTESALSPEFTGYPNKPIYDLGTTRTVRVRFHDPG